MKDRPHTGLPFADTDSVPRPSDDDRFMRDALEEGRRAGEHGDVPIGAAVVRDGAVVARAGNRTGLVCTYPNYAKYVSGPPESAESYKSTAP